MEIYTPCATTTATEGDSRCVALTMHTTPVTDAGCRLRRQVDASLKCMPCEPILKCILIEEA